MNDIVAWIILAVAGCAVIAYLIYKIIAIVKMSPEDRKKLIVTYLIGLVTLAEEQIGDGHGDDKLALVEGWFDQKAPVTYKVILSLLGKETLKELIEIALKSVKDNFGG